MPVTARRRTQPRSRALHPGGVPGAAREHSERYERCSHS